MSLVSSGGSVARHLVAAAIGLAACSANRVAVPPHSSPPPAPSERTMDEDLRALLSDAVAHPGQYPDLTLDYSQGHDLAGVTHFRADASGRYELRSNVTRGREERSWSGTLAAADRDSLFGILESRGFLAIPSSTRSIGDDEVPILVTLKYRDSSHTLRIWHDDAVRNADFHAIDAQVLAVARRLSGDALLLTAD